MISSFDGFADLVLAHARQRPSDTAFVAGERRLSWRDLAERASGVAAALSETGVGAGDRVALLVDGVDAHVALIGVWLAGAVPTPLPGFLPASGLARFLDDSQARALAATPAALEAARAAAAAAALVAPVVLDVSAAAPVADLRRPSSPAPDDACSVIYSSGTTGSPKGIVHSHRARMWTAASLAAGFAIGDRSRILLSTPVFTNGTWMMLLPGLLVGATILVEPRFEAEAFLERVRTGWVTHAFLVPTQFQALVDHPDWARADLSSLRTVVSAGAPMPEGLRARVRAKLGDVLHELWGLTEGVATIAGPQDLTERPGSVGRPSGGVEIKIVDESGREAPPDAVGEIAGRGPALMTGYLGRPDATAALLWRDGEGRAFMRTGDLGRLDRDGALRLHGRLKDVIISGGLNIYPVDLEAELLKAPGVLDAAVVAAPHPKWGETPVAFVRLAPGVDAQAVLDRANAALGRHQRIARIEVAAQDFPRNALGKVLKAELVARLSSEDRP